MGEFSSQLIEPRHGQGFEIGLKSSHKKIARFPIIHKYRISLVKQISKVRKVQYVLNSSPTPIKSPFGLTSISPFMGHPDFVQIEINATKVATRMTKNPDIWTK